MRARSVLLNILYWIFLIEIYNIQICDAGKALTGTKFANTTVYAGMILTDPTIAEVLGRDFHKVPQGVNGTARHNAEMRIQHAKETAKQLPFAVDFWYSIHAPPCPNRMTKGNDRGVSLTHFQIWHDFYTQGVPLPRTPRNAPFPRLTDASDKDILVLLEDDAVVAVDNVAEILQQEFLSMTTDHLFLGWCYGRRHMPMCTHAYAITRAGAGKLLKYYDTCYTHAIDAQIRHFAEQGVFSWRKPSDSYQKHLKKGFEDNPNYFTRGIFVQKKGFVSFNHHGFQNNAG